MENFNLPENLKPLLTVASNMWWSWNQDVWTLFEEVNPKEWPLSRNPIKCLKTASQESLSKLNNDRGFTDRVSAVGKRLENYLTRTDRWYAKNYADKTKDVIAYFSAEYGIHESLPIYSGGLGVLSGDHTKSSSDLGIPMAFVGLFYHEGYFTQQIDHDGNQVDVYDLQDPQYLPVEAIKTQDGKDLIISVDLPGRKVFVKTWRVRIGINNLYLLDSNIPENDSKDRALTARLYGGDREMRISQEIILGIGGVRALYAMGIQPRAYHMNEGHSAFFQLERISKYMKEKGISFYEAKILCSTNCLFTTHTPVPAGNEAFTLPVMEKYFVNYVKTNFGITWGEFLSLGLVSEKPDYKYFSLTVLAIRLSRFFNGVSELHGRIAQKMWKNLWPEVPETENPIDYVTNGVHTQTWTSNEMKNLFREYLGQDWEDHLNDQSFWDKATKLPNSAVKSVRHQLKSKMVGMVRTHLKEQLKRNAETKKEIEEVGTFLKENVLTVGFARRFATYKRATLIFKNPDRLASIINNPQRPVQFVFAGKAHPADIPGQEFIKDIYRYSREERFKGKIILLENYDMNISRHLVSGVDVWLNNPRRPLEASGTSGQKVPLNGGLNFSVLDGWWREGYDGQNGWVIGHEKDYPSNELQDQDDADNFYNTLEQTIVPLYYGATTDESEEWINKSKVSLITNISKYSTDRMVSEYAQKFYTKQVDQGRDFLKTEILKKYDLCYRGYAELWPSLYFEDFKLEFNKGAMEVSSRYSEFKNSPSHHVGIPLDHILPGRVFRCTNSKLETKIYIGDIDPEKIRVEAVITRPDSDEYEIIELENTKKVAEGLYLFKTIYMAPDETPRHLRVRVYPLIDHSVAKFELGLMHWY